MALVLVFCRGQTARLLRELGRRGQRSARVRTPSGAIQCDRDVSPGPLGRAREMQCALLRVDDKLRESPMQCPSLTEPRGDVDAGREQRMGEPDTFAVQLDDVRVARGSEAPLRIPAYGAGHTRERWLRQRRGCEKRGPSFVRQRPEPLPDE